MASFTVVAHVFVLVLSGAVTTRLAVVAWRRRDRPGAYPFFGLMTAASIWSFTYAAGLLVATEQLRVAFEQLQWFGIAFVPLYLLLFVAEYTGFEGLQRPRSVLGLAAVPLLTLAFVLTNPWHHLFWETTTFVQHDGLTFAQQQFGAWYYVNLLYTYLLTGGGVFVLLYAIRESRSTFRSRLLLLLLGIAVPFVANLASILDYQLVAGMDMTPYVFAVTGLAFSRAVFDYGLFDRTPSVLQLGQLYAFDDLNDGVLVTDGGGAVALHNSTAAAVFDETDLLDLDVERLLPVVPVPEADPVVVDVGERTYEIGASTVTDASARVLGTTYLFHDVTDREARLEELERSQDVLRGQRARLERQREDLLELDALNRTLRSINQALVNSQTATAVAENVTNQLRTSRLYDDASIAADHVDETTVARTEETTATQTEETTVSKVEEAASDSPGVMASPDATSDGGDADAPGQALTIPLRFGPTDYGSLRITTSRPGAFDETEVAVLEELSETVALALSAIETRETLLSDAVVELTYSIDGGSALADASADVECELVVSSTVPRDESTVLAYVDVRPTSDASERVDGDVVDSVVASLQVAAGVLAAKRVPNRDTVELHVDERSPLVVAVGRGANVVSAAARDATATLVVETASGADVRTLTEALSAVVDGVDLTGKRERAPVDTTTEADVGGVDADLTGRQAESLAAAHDAGYFGWPRDSTAEEVADAMGIAPSTFHSHLRKAQGKLVEWYVEERDND
jgi:predicted DNA binding protein